MSSTNDDKLRELVGTFFDDVLMPMAERMRANGVQPFSMSPDVLRLKLLCASIAMLDDAR